MKSLWHNLFFFCLCSLKAQWGKTRPLILGLKMRVYYRPENSIFPKDSDISLCDIRDLHVPTLMGASLSAASDL